MRAQLRNLFISWSLGRSERLLKSDNHFQPKMNHSTDTTPTREDVFFWALVRNPSPSSLPARFGPNGELNSLPALRSCRVRWGISPKAIVLPTTVVVDHGCMALQYTMQAYIVVNEYIGSPLIRLWFASGP
jgi:hypothetical protein